MKQNQHISLVLGNETWSEVMTAIFAIIREAGGEFPVSHADIGGELYFKGYPDGVSPDAWRNIKNNKILFKAPVDIPTIEEVEALEQSIADHSDEDNYTPINLQKTFPHVDGTLKKNLRLLLDIIIPSIISNQPTLIKENSEQISSNNDYMHVYADYSTVSNCNYHDYLSVANSAFNYGAASGINKFLIVRPDDDSNLSDVLFVQAFKDLAENYPDISFELQSPQYLLQHYSSFSQDTAIIVSRQYGNLCKDICYQDAIPFCNSVVSVGNGHSLFTILDSKDNNEAIQPLGLIHSAIILLASIGKIEAANKIHYAVARATENGVAKVTIESFMEQVASYVHEYDGSIIYKDAPVVTDFHNEDEQKEQTLVGADIFISYSDEIVKLSEIIQKATKRSKLKIQFILANKQEIWPNPPSVHNEHEILQLRFMPIDTKISNDKEILKLLKLLFKSGLNFVSFKKLYVYDSYLGFSMPDR